MAPTTRVILAVLFLAAGSAHAQVVECSPEQKLLPAVSEFEAAEHRMKALPAVTYPAGSRRNTWVYPLTLRIDAAGAVECWEQTPGHDPDRAVAGLDASRREVIERLPEWRYAPFLRDGKAVPVIVRERLREERSPAKRRAPSDVTADRVRISMERTECYGTCPAYFVEVRGDGTAIYEGRSHVTVLGKHQYRVDPAKVAQLVERARGADLWSAERRYAAAITDNPTTTLWIAFGKQEREIVDYAGERVGMPVAITGFQDLVDELAGTRQWTHLTIEGVAALEAEGFAFASRAGGELLARAVRGPTIGDDAALVRLVELGAPPQGFDGVFSLIESALTAGRPKLVDALIARGALDADGRADARKIDAAFQAAIRGGDAALIEKIWNVGGGSLHPSQRFDDADVILLLDGAYQDPPKRLLAAVRFLESKGSRLDAVDAKGETLLHIAANANDAELVRYLVAKKLDPNAVSARGISPLGMTHDEEVTMLLLEAGADPSKMSDEDYDYRAFVEVNAWTRVRHWLDSHGH